MIVNSVLNARIVLTPSVVCFILWAIQTPNRPPTPIVLFDSEKICGMGEVYLTVSKHKTRTDVRIKLIFPFCVLKIMQFSDCVIENCFAVTISRVMREWVWEIGGTWLFLFFDFFLATLERNHSYCLLKVYKLIVYINNY